MTTPTLHCPSCRRDIPLPPQKCPSCGAEMQLLTPPPKKQSLHPIFIILLIFLVLGPFGFGMLWRSNRFTLPAKWALTVITIVYTVALLWALYILIYWTLAEVDQVMNQLEY